MSDIEKQLAAELSKTLAKFGIFQHAVQIWTNPKHGAVQIALLGTDRRENLTGLNGTGLEQVARA